MLSSEIGLRQVNGQRSRAKRYGWSVFAIFSSVFSSAVYDSIVRSHLHVQIDKEHDDCPERTKYQMHKSMFLRGIRDMPSPFEKVVLLNGL